MRFAINANGSFDAGSLARLGGKPSGAGRRPSLPHARVDIENGQALIDAPFGALTMNFAGAGTLGRDFVGRAQIAETTSAHDAFTLTKGRADLVALSRDDKFELRFASSADGVVWNGARITGAAFTLSGTAPLSLDEADMRAGLRADAMTSRGINARALAANASLVTTLRNDALAPAVWRTDARAGAEMFALGDVSLRGAAFEASGLGVKNEGRGQVRLHGDRFTGIALDSQQPDATGEFAFNLDTGEGRARAQLTLAQTALSANAQQRIRNYIPNAGGAPIGPTMAQLESALDRGADRFDLSAPIALTWRNNGATLQTLGPIEANAASGTQLHLAPTRDAPAIIVQWPGAQLHAVASLALSGGGAPDMALNLSSLQWAQGAPLSATGVLAIRDWHSGGTRIASDALQLQLATSTEGGGRLGIVGHTIVDGPLADGAVRGLDANLDLTVAWRDGWRVTPNQPCMAMRIGSLEVVGMSLSGSDVQLCPPEGALIAANAQGRLSGGFDIAGLRLAGTLKGDRAPTHLNAARVQARFSGTQSNVELAIETQTPSLNIAFDPQRSLALTGQRISALARFGGGEWRVDGAFEAGELRDASLPGVVSAIAGRWGATPENGQAVIRVSAGEARIVAHPAKPDDDRPLFNPLRITNASATVQGGEIDANGQIVLEQGARGLATFTAHHEVDSGAGVAHIRADQLQFSGDLQPFEISELARGVFENVSGPAGVTADVNWTREEFGVSGVVSARGLSLATSTIPIIEDVRGDIHFSDLLTLTTPPGQEVTIGLINPGVAVRNGRARFQLLPDLNVRIESTTFEFAGGTLSIAPTQIALNADEQRVELTLQDVDVERLVSQLNIADIRATGHVEGRFPLRLTRQTSYIENGTLRAQAPGGEISYIGTAGEAIEGPGKMAFEALSGFRYDSLSLTLNGDLSGDVVTQVNFSGQNTGRPVHLSQGSSVPGFGQVSVLGVPFHFNVTVTAPFRRLADTAAGFTDARTLLDRAQTPPAPQPTPQTPVDQTPPQQR